MNELQVLQVAAGICRHFEGFRSRVYLCPAGVWTIGYGSTFYEDGRRVGPKDPPITQARAEQLLQHMLKVRFLPWLKKLSPKLKGEARAAALLDFLFNCGPGAYQASTLRRRVNADDWDAAYIQIQKWNRVKGVTSKGLTKRRLIEALMFF